ncbi:DNA (cytosine-5-)-methyltransferase [Mycoplasmopsis gallopavonis]|uniref:Cytosine-specific methyltransferase n=1 Tax=Mycoplasmopsis gallopavonis TaxID=76629 RepID=A0A449AZV3_9BACT|nr:DNA (cytosine-5-)-methyltransferase [Mycoplasmopsis gallopavonis]RIV16890.1 DNA (cytosine-5-)-methyltransferase [Mycoplasmopsis gallopavonis]VEU73031.1 Cytosine-specific DNA methyltransferase/Type II site-specific deoxyribonuclease [Mycoplasmopsis gallopavonis]
MKKRLKFFDFCAGIGAGRLGLEQNNLECVGHSEIDDHANLTYTTFFNDHNNYGDLTKIDAKNLPDFDFLIAGFPCQTFSIAGKRGGFEDERGQIIYFLINIMKQKEVKYFILENVKGLVNHDKGHTFKVIRSELQKAGYTIFYKVLNSLDFGVAQTRERIYIVGFKNELNITNFNFPEKEQRTNFEDFIDENNNLEFDINDKTFQKYLANKYNQNKYSNEEILSWENCVIDWRQSDLRKYEGYFPTLRTGRHGLLYVKNKKVWKLNGYESLLLQGFPKEMAGKIKNKMFNNNKILSQAGNAMTVNVIKRITKNMLDEISFIERNYE